MNEKELQVLFTADITALFPDAERLASLTTNNDDVLQQTDD